MAKKKNTPVEEETLDQIAEELEQEQQEEAAEEVAKPEIEPNVPIYFETATRAEAQEKVQELKTKAASMGLCKMESTPIMFVKQDYLDPGHFKVKLIFSK